MIGRSAMFRRSALVGVAYSAAVLGAAPALAQIYTDTIVGTVSKTGNELDSQSLFGGGNLAGDSYTEVFTINTMAGSGVQPGSVGQDIYGGSSFSLGPAVSATITINGHAVTLDGSYSDQAQVFANPAAFTSTTHGLVSDDVETVQGGTLYDISGSVQSLTTAVGFPSTLGGAGYLQVNGTTITGLGDFQVQNSRGRNLEYLTLNPTALDPAPSAPEPSAWALLIAGVAAIGAMLRYTRRDPSLAAVG